MYSPSYTLEYRPGQTLAPATFPPAAYPQLSLHIPYMDLFMYLRGALREVERLVVHLRGIGLRSAHRGWQRGSTG